MTYIKSICAKGLGMLLITLLLSACASNKIKPIPKDLIGNATVKNVEVVTLDSVKSDTLVDSVRKAITDEANNNLKGNRPINIKVSLDKWVTPEQMVGGSFTGKLLGSNTELNGIVDIIDPGTGDVIAKYSIYASHKEGGLLGATTTISVVNVEKAVISKFASFTIDELE